MSTATNSKQKLRANQIVIQCPSCQTKFALDASLIEGIEQPRFHCSRCDHLFGIDENGLMNAKKMADATIPQDAPSWENSGAARPPRRRLEIPDKPARALNATAPHQNDDLEESNRVDEISDTQMSFDFSAEDASAHAEEEQGEKGQYYIPRFSVRGDDSGQEPVPCSTDKSLRESVNEQLPVTDAAEYASSLPEEPQLTNSAARPKELRQPSWRNFAFVAGIIMGFLALLGGFALFVRSESKVGGSVVAALFPAGQKVAPAGLYIKNTKFKKVTLDSGDSVYVVSGKVVNQSTESFDTVVVEALAFDGAGMPIVRTRTGLSSTLAEKRIRSLTPDMIRTIQEQPPISFRRLRTGDAEEFAIALGNGAKLGEFEKAKFFSARVYSVQ